MSRYRGQNVANFRSTIDAAPMCQVNICLQNNKSEQCWHMRCYFHSAGWHPLFSPMILFLCTNWESDLTQGTSWVFPRNGTVPFGIRGVILYNTIIRLIKFCYNKSNKRNCNVCFEICFKILIFHWQQINKHLKACSLISYRGRAQKFQNLNFLHLFVAFLQKGHFPKGI